MISDIRAQYNEHFSAQRYEDFLVDLHDSFDYHIRFRVAESPIFIGRDFRQKLSEACDDMVAVLCQENFKSMTRNAVPPHFAVPNENKHSLFCVMDFGVCVDEEGELSPQLIEFQGCPSLYFYQDWVAGKYRKHFKIPEDYRHLGSDLKRDEYISILKNAILGKQSPKNVIILELDPEEQHTRIDFLCTEKELGIKTICISDIIKEGRKLFYIREGVKTAIHRIYNRLIFEEAIHRPDLDPEFKMTDEVDVEWAGHPNWFFRISKYTLPFIRSKYVPETHFLHQVQHIPEDLENYVLKPLFAFGGEGVIFDVEKKDIENIPSQNRNEYILQKKVTYAPVIQAPDGMVKCEIRVLFVWPEDAEKPRIVTNLARLSRGKLIGVKYNKDKTWVGGSVCFFEP